MTRLTLICHAATVALRHNAFSLDEPVEPAGKAAATGMAAALRPAGRARTSPALRARQTADAMGLAAVPDPALRDLDVGRWAGSRLADIAAAEPEALASWLADPAVAPHGGETLEALTLRVADWLGNAHGGGRVIAVTHPAVIRAAILHALGAPMRAFWRIDVVPLSVAVLTAHAGGWNLRALGSGRDAEAAP